MGLATNERKYAHVMAKSEKINAVMKLMEAKGMSVDDLENLVSGQ